MNTERGGIGDWVLVIVSIALILFMAGFFGSQKNIFNFNFKSFLHLSCGLTVKAPLADQKIVFPAQVKGYANDCGWQLENGAAGMAQVFDATGVAVTKPTPLSVAVDSTQAPYYFQTVLNVYQPPHTDTGHMVFTSTTGLVSVIAIKF